MQFLATPWWVNLAALVPAAAYLAWHKRKLSITSSHLLYTAVFAIAFGFNEAVVVVYLRAAVGLLPGYGGTTSDLAQLSSNIYQQAQILSDLPRSLVLVEIAREAATMLMLLGVTAVSSKYSKERCALFFWMFAFWDISYYLGLWATVRWPPSLLTQDVLFLIPVPWIAQVWFPLLISILVIVVVLLSKSRETSS